MLKAIIFDLNGIFVQAPKLGERLAQEYGVEHSAFMPKLHEIMHKIRQPGAKSAWIYWKEFLDEQKLNFTERKKGLNQLWKNQHLLFQPLVQNQKLTDQP